MRTQEDYIDFLLLPDEAQDIAYVRRGHWPNADSREKAAAVVAALWGEPADSLWVIPIWMAPHASERGLWVVCDEGVDGAARYWAVAPALRKQQNGGQA